MAAIKFNGSFNASERGFESEESHVPSSRNCNFGHDATSTQAARVVAYCVIIVVSTLGNSMTIVVVWQDKAMRKTLDFLIVNLAATDLVITLVYVPRVIVMWLRGTEWLVKGVFGSVLCKIVPFLHGTSILVSILTLMTLAVDKFLAIVFPLNHRITVKNSKFIIAFIWFLATAVRFPYLYSLKIEFKSSSSKLICDANIEKAFGNDQAREVYYTFLLVAFYGVPFIVIMASYLTIVVTLRQHKVFREDINTARSRVAQATRDKASRKVLYMLLTVTAAFVFCWLTYFIAQVVFAWMPCSLRFWRLFLAHSNSALNPCLYAVFNKKFRHGFKRLLSLFCCNRH